MIVGHLPLSTQFQFCEIELGQLVSDKTVASFADEFKFRETKRAQLKRERGNSSSDQAKPAPAVPQPVPVADDALLAAAIEESKRMAEAQAAHTGAGTPAVSIPTTPSSAALDSSPSESPSSGILPSRRNATQPTDLLSSITAIFRLRSARSVGQETAHHRNGGHVLVFLIQQSAGTCAQAREGTPPPPEQQSWRVFGFAWPGVFWRATIVVARC